MLKMFSNGKDRARQLENELTNLQQRIAILDHHIGIGLWEAIIHNGDATLPESRWTWSAEFARLLGFKPDEFPNRMNTWSDRLHPDDAPRVFAAFGSFISDKSGNTPYCVEYRLRMKDSSYRWFNATGGCSRDAHGVPLRTCGSLTDIHDRKVAEALDRDRTSALSDFVRSIGNGFSALSAGDLTVRMTQQVASEFEPIRKQFNDSLSSLEEAIGSVVHSIGALRMGLNEINTASGDLSKRTEQQAASLEETVAALTDVTRGVNATAGEASKAQKTATIALKNAEKGGAIVSQAVGAMGQIEKSSSEIGKIIGVIDEIAFQTNLLALNAGVEAARAGEAGRGFAVVAQEVRGLAQRSAEAAKEIKTLIAASSAQVEHGVALVTASGTSLQEIVSQVATMSEVVTGIARSANEQSLSLKEVSMAADNMDKVTQQNAAMVEETTAAAQTLVSKTDELAALVERFRTNFAAGRTSFEAPLERSGKSNSQRPVAQMRSTGKGGAVRKQVKDEWEAF